MVSRSPELAPQWQADAIPSGISDFEKTYSAFAKARRGGETSEESQLARRELVEQELGARAEAAERGDEFLKGVIQAIRRRLEGINPNAEPTETDQGSSLESALSTHEAFLNELSPRRVENGYKGESYDTKPRLRVSPRSTDLGHLARLRMGKTTEELQQIQGENPSRLRQMRAVAERWVRENLGTLLVVAEAAQVLWEEAQAAQAESGSAPSSGPQAIAASTEIVMEEAA